MDLWFSICKRCGNGKIVEQQVKPQMKILNRVSVLYILKPSSNRSLFKLIISDQTLIKLK